MFEANDEKYLLRALGQNKVVLFLGAGFSQQARNQHGNPLPSGRELAGLIWNFLGYDGDYDFTPLPEMYEALLTSGKAYAPIRNFLEDHLLCSEVPAEYSALTLPYWYRIYTTNVDDLVKQVYSKAIGVQLEILFYPADDILERDQSLEKIQLLHLNGRLPCQPTEVTFSTRQYARGALVNQPLYEQFVRDYSTYPVIFVGTQLNEPLLWQYIEARGKKATHIPEHRPKSFLIAPRISQPKQAQLEFYNVTPVKGTAFDFTNWIQNIASKLPSRIEVVRAAAPGLAEIIEGFSGSPSDLRQIKMFGECFAKVPSSCNVVGDRSMFLMGASPRWEDLFRGLDTPRTVTEEIFRYISALFGARDSLHLIPILGSAGCGKSTILRRLGVRLIQAGRSVYFTRSERLPAPSVIRGALESIGGRTVLLFDNSEVILSVLTTILQEVASLDRPPIVVIASRTNDFDRLWGRFKGAAEIKEVHVPNLDREEIKKIIQILEENGLLGQLQGMSQSNRIREFEERAHKQILVAMREATSGRGFDEIIKDEFQRLVPEETKLLYLCVALATDAGYSIDKGEFVRFASVPPAEALELLDRNLRDIIIYLDQRNDMLMLRHQQIAEYVVGQSAPRPLLRDAYIRLLSVLASEIRGKTWRSRVFALYRDVVNHTTIYRRFANDINEARSIYNALSPYLQKDSQFWLQWGSLELEGGSLEFAENYLNQAESLDNQNSHIKNARAHLLLKEGIEAPNLPTAIAFRDEGSKILEERIYTTDFDDAYAVHICCYYRYYWMRRWNYDDDDAQRGELEKLRVLSTNGLSAHPRHIRLKLLKEGIEKAYLQLALPRGQRPTEPTI